MNDISQGGKNDEVDRKKVLILGGGVAGMTLAMDLIRKDKNLEITVIKKEAQGSYSPCGMPFVLEGKVGKMEDIILHSTDFYMGKGIHLITGSEATNMDFNRQLVHLNSGETLGYDFLAIATGRKPFIPPIQGIDLEGVHTLSSYDDGLIVMKAIKDTKEATVIGGGVIGLETACAFSSHDIQTTVIEMLPSILPQILDPDMANIIQSRLESLGIKVLTSTKVTSIEGDKTARSVATDKGEIKADFVLIATGIRPNIDLAKNAGITLGKFGGIVTNSLLNIKKGDSFIENVFALGDCIEIMNKITCEPQISALASSAAFQARIVSANICGTELGIQGFLSPTITVIGDLQVGSVGLTSHTAKQSSLEPKIGKAKGWTRSTYYPNKKEIHIKLLANNGELIGAQLISEEDVKERINAITLAIQNKITIDQLLYTERCFTPPLSLMTDPFIRALENF